MSLHESSHQGLLYAHKPTIRNRENMDRCIMCNHVVWQGLRGQCAQAGVSRPCFSHNLIPESFDLQGEIPRAFGNNLYDWWVDIKSTTDRHCGMMFIESHTQLRQQKKTRHRHDFQERFFQNPRYPRELMMPRVLAVA
jgi:hypothetical protein